MIYIEDFVRVLLFRERAVCWHGNSFISSHFRKVQRQVKGATWELCYHTGRLSDLYAIRWLLILLGCRFILCSEVIHKMITSTQRPKGMSVFSAPLLLFSFLSPPFSLLYPFLSVSSLSAPLPQSCWLGYTREGTEISRSLPTFSCVAIPALLVKLCYLVVAVER